MADVAPKVLWTDGVEVVLALGDRIVRGAVERRGGRTLVHWRGEVFEVEAATGPSRQGSAAASAGRELFAPMTGTVVQVYASDGQPVERGAPLLVVEAMKMEHRIVAPAKARVARVHVKKGDQVDVGAPLVSLDGGDSSP
jgi:3-methylcrotonyl-CoA carboxylase alpha subunit